MHSGVILQLSTIINGKTVFMPVNNKSSYVGFYMPFVPRKGSLNQPYLTTPGAAGLLTSHHPFRIAPKIHHVVLHVHHLSTAAVTPLSANMWLVRAAGRPPFLVPTGQETILPPIPRKYSQTKYSHRFIRITSSTQTNYSHNFI